MRAYLREIIITVVLALVIFLLLQIVIQSYVIIYSCMEPNLEEGQRLLVSKVVYHFHEPERGDVIVFRPPANPEATPYIKRIIGLPNETIEIKNGAVYIDGEQLYEPYVKEPPRYTVHRQKIAEDNYFVLGDNRNNSNDSHNGWTVPRQNVIGKAWLSIWPLSKWGLVAHYPSPEQIVAWLEPEGGAVDK